jgi:hypothetical protein
MNPVLVYFLGVATPLVIFAVVWALIVVRNEDE